MDSKTVLDIISDIKKAQYLLLALPLITFIFYKINLFIIIGYTISFAIQSLYVYIMVSFNKVVTRDVMVNRKLSLNTFWYLPYLWLFILIFIINIIAFGYSFYMSGINYNSMNVYSQTLLLLHVFVATLSISLLLFIRKIKKKLPENIRKSLRKDGKTKK